MKTVEAQRVLGVGPHTTWNQVVRRWRHLARQCHPDVAGRSSTARFQRVAQAYAVLMTAHETTKNQKTQKPEDVQEPRPGPKPGGPGGRVTEGTRFEVLGLTLDGAQIDPARVREAILMKSAGTWCVHLTLAPPYRGGTEHARVTVCLPGEPADCAAFPRRPGPSVLSQSYDRRGLLWSLDVLI